MKEDAVDISLIVVNRNTCELLPDCISSINNTAGNHSFEIMLVDNGSTDDSVGLIGQLFPEVIIIENKTNLGFAKANNAALKRMRGRFAVLLNTDARLKERSIDVLIDFMDKTPEAGICGGQLLNEVGSKQNSIANTPSLLTELGNKSLLRFILPEKYPGKENNFTQPIEVESIIGACMVVRKEAILDVGLLDEDYFFFYEETDWCLKFRKKGWKVFHHPGAFIFHLQGKTVEKTYVPARIEYWRSRYIFFRKHRGALILFILRMSLMLKLSIGIFFLFLCNIAVLFLIRKCRGKLLLQARLFFWHLVGCPDSWGLAPACGEAISN
jgi:hypothetical protein